MARATRPSGRGLPMTTSSTSRSVRSLATASSRGTRPFIGTSDDEVTMIRPGTGSTSAVGRKTVWSTPTGTTVIRSGRRPPSAPRCPPSTTRDTVTTRGRARATRTCMREEPEPAPLGEALPRVRRVAERELAVDGDRVVQRRRAAASRRRSSRGCRCRGTGCRGRGRTRRGRAASKRRARREKVHGSGKPAVHMTPNSRAAIDARYESGTRADAGSGTGPARGRGRGSAPA